MRDSEQDFYDKYSSQDKEIHHLHHNVSSMQTTIKRQVEQVVNSALGGWKQQNDAMQSQLTEVIIETLVYPILCLIPGTTMTERTQ